MYKWGDNFIYKYLYIQQLLRCSEEKFKTLKISFLTDEKQLGYKKIISK